MPSRVVLGLSVVSLTLFLPILSLWAADAEGVLTDEQTLRAASLGTDGPALLEFFRKRANADASPEHIEVLVKQLGAPSPEARDKAVAELICIGSPTVLPLLHASHYPPHPVISPPTHPCIQ